MKVESKFFKKWHGFALMSVKSQRGCGNLRNKIVQTLCRKQINK